MDPVEERAAPPAATAAAPAAPTPITWADVWTRIRDHRILQWTLAYLAATLAIGQGYELLGNAYHWPDAVRRVVMGLLVVGLPVAIVLGWYHGDRKLKNVSGAEATIIAILLLIGAGLLIVLAPDKQPAASRGAPAATLARSTKPRIAILPFENLSPDPNNAFFADAIHQEILATLATRVPSLEVISRTTMMLYRTAPTPVAEMARELNATYVLEGSVRREGDQVRLRLELIDAATLGTRWSQSYNRTLVSAMTLESEVAAEVAGNLSVEITGGGVPAAPPTRDPGAYDLYSQARLGAQVVGPYLRVTVYRTVEDLLTRAIERDPQFAAAYLERANIRLLMFTFNYDSSNANGRAIRSDLDTARRLGGGANVLAAEGQYQSIVENDHERALATFKVAEAAGLADPTWLLNEAYILLRTRHVDEALRLGDRMMTLDPGNPFLLTALAGQRLFLQQPQESLRIIDLGLERAPTFPQLRAMRAVAIRYFTGRDVGSGAPPADVDESFLRDVQYEALMRAGRYSEAVTGLDGFPDPGRVIAGGPGLAFAVGDRPLAEYRGWAHLLLGDRTSAAADGEVVLEFLARDEQTVANRWFHGVLAMEAQTFKGDCEPAVLAARETLAAARRSEDAFPWVGTVLIAARVHAWCGSADEAVALMEEAVSSKPLSRPPIFITDDPTINVRLENDAGYRALKQRLEAQMAATKLE